MAYRKTINAACLVALVLTLPACGYIFPAKYRYRMTVEVQTTQGVQPSSAVYEIGAYQTPRLTSEEASGRSELKGQALEIGPINGPVFVLMRTPEDNEPFDTQITNALSHLSDLSKASDYVSAVRKLGNPLGRSRAVLPRSAWPMMVQFANLNDPNPVKEVKPEAIGVIRITLETTSEPITEGIQRKLLWLGDPGLTLDPHGRPTIHPSLAQTISQSSFWQGNAK